MYKDPDNSTIKLRKSTSEEEKYLLGKGTRGEDQACSLKFKKSRQGNGVLLAGIVCLGAGLYRLWRRHLKLKQQLNETRVQLAASDSQIEELSNQLKLTKEELNIKQMDLLALALALEEKTIELSKEKEALEVARGELGLTRSKIGIIERELNITKRSLSSYQTRLDQVRFDLEMTQISSPSNNKFWE